MKLNERIELEAKDTIGYSESKDKESFMIGVSVAFRKTEEHYEREVELLKKQVEFYKSCFEKTSDNLKTLSSIINQYSDND